MSNATIVEEISTDRTRPRRTWFAALTPLICERGAGGASARAGEQADATAAGAAPFGPNAALPRWTTGCVDKDNAGPRAGPTRWSIFPWAFTAFTLLASCGQKNTASDQPQPVPECVAYEKAMAACFHRDLPFATQPSVLPANDADRARIRSMCIENMARLRRSCP